MAAAANLLLFHRSDIRASYAHTVTNLLLFLINQRASECP